MRSGRIVSLKPGGRVGLWCQLCSRGCLSHWARARGGGALVRTVQPRRHVDGQVSVGLHQVCGAAVLQGSPPCSRPDGTTHWTHRPPQPPECTFQCTTHCTTLAPTARPPPPAHCTTHGTHCTTRLPDGATRPPHRTSLSSVSPTTRRGGAGVWLPHEMHACGMDSGKGSPRWPASGRDRTRSQQCGQREDGMSARVLPLPAA